MNTIIKKMNIKEHQKTIIRYSLYIIVPFIFLYIILVSYIGNLQLSKSIDILVNDQCQNAETINYIIENEMSADQEDLLIVSNSSELIDFINNNNETTLSEAQDLFVRISNNKEMINQIRYIDETGMERIRLKVEEGESTIVADELLQNISDRYYYVEISLLHEGEVFVSPIDLYKENDMVVEPYQPIIRMGTPIYSSNNEYQGIIVVNYHAKDILNFIIDQYDGGDFDPNISLVNDEGYYIYNNEDKKPFGFMFPDGLGYTLKVDNPSLWTSIQTDETGKLTTDDEIVIFNQITPLSTINDTQDNEYVWYLVSSVPFSYIPEYSNNVLFGLDASDVFVLFSLCVMIMITIGFYVYLRQNQDQLLITQKIAENMNDAAIITDENKKIVYVNKAFERISGYTQEEVIGLNPKLFQSGLHDDTFYREIMKELHESGHYSGEVWNKKKDGVYYPQKLDMYRIKSKNDKRVIHYLAISTDIVEIEDTNKMLNKIMNFNHETDLPNQNIINKLIDNSMEENENFGLICFRVLNYNNLLINYGDRAIELINSYIKDVKEMLKEEDFIAQISTNKFVIGLPYEKKDIDLFMEQFIKKNSVVRTTNDIEYSFDVKAGISVYPEDGDNAVDLLSKSNLALGNASRIDGCKYEYYSKQLESKIAKESQINLMMKKAIELHEFDVYYQPQVNSKTKEVIGVEALMRWNSPRFGTISPNVFIPLAEKSGYIIEIGYWLIERVFQDFKRSKKILSDDFRVSINISSVQFNDDQLLPMIKKLAEKYDCCIENLEIEITESTVIEDFDMVNNKLKQFKELGITVAIDDFGTGYSSLSYLKNLYIDKLKIDRAFIKDYPNRDDGEIAQIINNIGKSLQLNVISEGAETAEQISFLSSIKCNVVQGFYYSKPLSYKKFMEYYIKTTASLR